MGRRREQTGAFEDLAALKGQVRRASPEKASETLRRRAQQAPTPPDDEQNLLQHSMAGVTALKKADNHAQLHAPKPAALPRQRLLTPEPEQPLRAMPESVLGIAYLDVTPLKDCGRVDMSHYRADKATGKDAAPPPERAPQSQAPKSEFEQAMAGAIPLADTGRLHIKPAPPPAIPQQRLRNEHALRQESLAASLPLEDRLDMGDEQAFLRPGIPRRVLADLRRGRWAVQGELDLHGLTRDQARQALVQFLNYSLKEGKRCLRLIHGQGHGSPGREPVLKHLSKSWLSQCDDILAFCHARSHEGGAGALLILLRAGHKSAQGSRPL